ncbi:MAG: hypothetical protein RIG62_21965 [Cyclobacteriaceae bacterium]|jgi:hypothetical protein
MKNVQLAKAILIILCVGCSQSVTGQHKDDNQLLRISGIYPHLAYYNNEGECGTGAVVPWADRLWVITYGPHLPDGSSDKLYEITRDLQQIVREESLGGTPANRLIHKESQQLFIGPYAIDDEGTVRAIPYSQMAGRHTGTARHLSDPENKVYYATMEEGFYEVDVNSLAVNTLYPDANRAREKDKMAQHSPLLPGAHGKGAYSGQGVLVYSNNGEATREAVQKFDVTSGALMEWDGQDWTLVRRNQFVEVTGPGGIYGNANPETDPIWATGWDHKSIILACRQNDTWEFYRLPKASHSYDGAHGWNTEWPRIRNIGTDANPDYMMTMHGMFWKFPGTFSHENTAGIRPRSAYLKVVGDFTRWGDQLVFGCDDSANKEFANKRSLKGKIEGAGQSNSNLWFTTLDKPDHLGPTHAEGAVWVKEDVKAGEISEPFLFSGWETRSCWIKNHAEASTSFTLEVDTNGNGHWKSFRTIEMAGGDAERLVFPSDLPGEWVRVVANDEANVTAQFYYGDKDDRSVKPNHMFQGLAHVSESETTGGLLYSLGDNRRTMGIAACAYNGTEATDYTFYELDKNLQLAPKDDAATLNHITKTFAIPTNVLSVEESSILITDDKGRRWRLPKSPEKGFDALTKAGALRLAREVSTERDLFNCHGTFYELPAENADGFAKVRPVSSHTYRVHDFASYRGLLIMSGLTENSAENSHIIKSADGKAALWAGAIDDLWEMGKPTGVGGPWMNTEVVAEEPSDPYLIAFYSDRTLELSHQESHPVTIRVEADPTGTGIWMNYEEFDVPAGETVTHVFPENFQARWVRFVANQDAQVTTSLTYK